MRMRVRWKGAGAEEIRRKLELMPEEVSGAALREATLEGAEVIRAQAEANVRAVQRTGTLAGDIHAEINERRTTNTRAEALIGPGKEGWYGRLVEHGHDVVRGTRKATRQVIGHVPAHPWLRPAGDAKRAEAEETTMHGLLRRLERVWRGR